MAISEKVMIVLLAVFLAVGVVPSSFAKAETVSYFPSPPVDVNDRPQYMYSTFYNGNDMEYRFISIYASASPFQVQSFQDSVIDQYGNTVSNAFIAPEEGRGFSYYRYVNGTWSYVTDNEVWASYTVSFPVIINGLFYQDAGAEPFPVVYSVADGAYIPAEPDAGTGGDTGTGGSTDTGGLSGFIGSFKEKLSESLIPEQLRNSWSKLKLLSGAVGEPPKLTLDLGKLYFVGANESVQAFFGKSGVPVSFNNGGQTPVVADTDQWKQGEESIVVDFAQLNKYQFGGIALIEYFRMLISVGFLMMTFRYVWSKIMPSQAV